MSFPSTENPSSAHAHGYPVLAREDFSDDCFALHIAHPDLARAARPGQFVMLMLEPQGERIPLTLADFDPACGSITLVIQAAGYTTRRIQRECRAGDYLHSVAGPMGRPSAALAPEPVIFVGGGLGIAPVFPLARQHHQQGGKVLAVLGFRNRSSSFWLERFEAIAQDLIICSDDGSIGMTGRVTDGLQLMLGRHADIAHAVSIGPAVMMQACSTLTRTAQVPTSVSLNPIMVDGTGMCGGCRVRVNGKTRFACVDGPEFDAHQVDFAELLQRQQRYREEESRALSKWSDDCQLSMSPEPH